MGGWDLLYQYSHYTVNVPAPAWVWLIMSPLGWLSYPAMWLVWAGISVVIIVACAKVFRMAWWWLLPVSGAVVYNLWLGQVEPLVLAGVTLGWLVAQRKWHPALMGVAWMLMAIKPQVALLPMLLFGFWLWKERGLKAIVAAGAVSVGILIVSLLAYPSYLGDIMTTMRAYAPPEGNAAVFPLGLATLPLVLMPKLDRITRLRVALAVNLLASPYFQLYHTTTLLAVAGNPVLMVLSWIPTPMLIGLPLAWLIPLFYLLKLAIVTSGLTFERIRAWQS
jgi:hypothetical protein